MNTNKVAVAVADTSFAGIMKAIAANNGQAYDDVRHAVPLDKRKLSIKAIAQFDGRTVYMNVDDRVECFCMSTMYVDSMGFPHVSFQTVGPVICPAQHGGFASAVEAYNASTRKEELPFPLKPIENLTYL
jgi:hypothetical protein